MNRKRKKSVVALAPPAKPVAAPAAPDDDLSVLLPNRDVTIAGRLLTVREFTLSDSLVMHNELKPISVSLADVMQTEWPSFEHVMDVLAQHADPLLLLIARSCDQPADWIASLPGSEGTTLMDVFWTVNRRFFMTAANRLIVIRAALKKTQSGTAESSPNSHEQATTQSG